MNKSFPLTIVKPTNMLKSAFGEWQLPGFGVLQQRLSWTKQIFNCTDPTGLHLLIVNGKHQEMAMMLWSRDATALCLVAKYNVNLAGSINSMWSWTCLELDVWSGIVEIVWIDSVASKSHVRKLPDKVTMPGSAAERNLRWHIKHSFELYCHVLYHSQNALPWCRGLFWLFMA